jgi:hypothetical protein
MKSEGPVPGAERGLRSVVPATAAADPAKPVRSVLGILRHDAGSAAHIMQGFLDLFGSGALGKLSPVQEQSLGHMYQAAERMRELLETALDLGQPEGDAGRDEATSVQLSSLTQSVVHTLAQDEPRLSLLCDLLLPMEQPSLVRRGAFETALRTLLNVAREQGDAPLEIALAQTDLHTSLTILAGASEPLLTESVTQSLPVHAAFTTELDQLAPLLRNRDYLRLKRCEALLERQRGRLLVAPDLSRLRLLVPVQRER